MGKRRLSLPSWTDRQKGLSITVSLKAATEEESPFFPAGDGARKSAVKKSYHDYTDMRARLRESRFMALPTRKRDHATSVFLLTSAEKQIEKCH